MSVLVYQTFLESVETNVALDYYNLPQLPTNQDMTIAKIDVKNLLLSYKMFSDIDETAFPKGQDPQYDYMPDEFVYPVTIQDNNGVVYKTPMILWFILADIAGGISKKE